MLRCEECGCTSGEFGRGWVAFIADDLDEISELNGSHPAQIVLVYCPPCSAGEFGHRPSHAAEYT